MRTMLILILSLLLCAAALITRPGKREFVLHLLDAPDGHAPWSADAVQQANRVAKGVTFRNRWLWVDVERDGKVIYTGLFAHWVPRGEKLEGAVPDAGQMVKMVAALK